MTTAMTWRKERGRETERLLAAWLNDHGWRFAEATGAGLVGKWDERAALFASILPDWQGGSDLNNLSERQAGDLLLALRDQAKARTDA